ncbi:MAG: alanine racemase [Paracoccaceae bacterium]
MSLTATLTIDLGAIVRNWHALDRLSGLAETAAVLKSDAYGCGIDRVGPVLVAAGARTFFVALPDEGAALRRAVGPGPVIYCLAGYPTAAAPQERALFAEAAIRPVLNAPEQVAAWQASGAPGPVAVQLDTGMNRLGLEPAELAAIGLPAGTALVLSHLARADSPHAQNLEQRAAFEAMTCGLGGATGPVLSLAATGGTLLGAAFRYAMVRPGIGLFGGHPFDAAEPVVRLEAPVLQIRDVAEGEIVGYGGAWRAARPSRIATVSAGYADGILRAAGNRAVAEVAGRRCPFAGRVSMDLVTLDVTDAPDLSVGDPVNLLGPDLTIDQLGTAAGTIGYEILTSLGARYRRRYLD